MYTKQVAQAEQFSEINYPPEIKNSPEPDILTLDKSFKKKVYGSLLQKGLLADAEEFQQISPSIKRYLAINIQRKTFSIIDDAATSRFIELCQLAGFNLNDQNTINGFIWEKILLEYFSNDDNTYSLSPGSRPTNLFYTTLVLGTQIGKKLADNYELPLPTDYYDHNLTPLTRLFYVKYWLLKLDLSLPSEIFGFDLFMGQDIHINRAAEGSLYKYLQPFLSLLSSEERALTEVGHNYDPSAHLSPAEVRQFILERLGIYSLPDYLSSQNNLEEKFQSGNQLAVVVPLSKGPITINPTPSYTLLGKVIIIDPRNKWKATSPEQSGIVDYFELLRKNIMMDFAEANQYGYETIVYERFPSFYPIKMRDMLRLMVQTAQSFMTTKTSSALQLKDLKQLLVLEQNALLEDIKLFIEYAQVNALGEYPLETLRNGDIVRIRTTHADYERAVVIEQTEQTITLLPVHYWADNTIGFLESKKYERSEKIAAVHRYEKSKISELGLFLKKEECQTGYAVNVGEQYSIPYEGRDHRATIIGILHRHFILILDEPVATDLAGYALYSEIGMTNQKVKNGEWKKLSN